MPSGNKRSDTGSYPFYLSRSFLKVTNVSRIKLFFTLPNPLQTAEILSVQKEEKHQDAVSCGDVLHTWGGRQQRWRMEAPIRWEVLLSCEARHTRQGGPVCV